MRQSNITKIKLFLTIFTILLSHFLFFSIPVNAKSDYDNIIINQQPLKYFQVNYNNIENDCNVNRYSIQTLTSFSDLKNSFSSDGYSIKNFNSFNEIWKFSNENKAWAVIASNQKFIQDPENFEIDNLDKLMNNCFTGYYTNQFLISDKNLVWKFRTFRGRKLIYLFNPTNQDISLEIGSLSTTNNSKFTSFYHRKNIIIRAHSELDQSLNVNPTHIFVNTFGVEYPSGYEGPKFADTYSPFNSNDTFQANFSYQLKDNHIKGVPNPSTAQEHAYKYWSLEYIPNEQQNSIKLVDKQDADFFHYDLNENKKGEYYLTLELATRPPNTPKEYQHKTISFNYQGKESESIGSSDPNFLLPDSEPKFFYENCDALDFSCHIRNFSTKMQELFYRFKTFIRRLFIPDDKTYLITVFKDLKIKFNQKLGFLAYPITWIFGTLADFQNQAPVCQFGGSSLDATSPLFPNGFSVSFCNIKISLGKLYDFVLLVVRGSIVIGLIFGLKKQYERILSL